MTKNAHKMKKKSYWFLLFLCTSPGVLTPCTGVSDPVTCPCWDDLRNDVFPGYGKNEFGKLGICSELPYASNTSDLLGHGINGIGAALCKKSDTLPVEDDEYWVYCYWSLILSSQKPPLALAFVSEGQGHCISWPDGEAGNQLNDLTPPQTWGCIRDITDLCESVMDSD